MGCGAGPPVMIAAETLVEVHEMLSTLGKEKQPMRITHVAWTIAVVALAGCSKRPEAAPAAAADTATKPAAQSMTMSMAGMNLMPAVRAHLDSLGQATPAQLAGMMAGHQELMSRMMDAMGKDMRGMNMTPDAAWTALGDSVRQDLADLPGLSGTALKTRMGAHIGRMQRMLAMHEGMMKM